MDYEEQMKRAHDLGIEITFLEKTKEDYEKKEGEYTPDDCILVRATDVFPKGMKIETPKHGGAYAFGDSDVFQDDILKVYVPEIQEIKRPKLWFDVGNE